MVFYYYWWGGKPVTWGRVGGRRGAHRRRGWWRSRGGWAPCSGSDRGTGRCPVGTAGSIPQVILLALITYKGVTGGPVDNIIKNYRKEKACCCNPVALLLSWAPSNNRFWETGMHGVDLHSYISNNSLLWLFHSRQEKVILRKPWKAE